MFHRPENYRRPWHVDMLDTAAESYHSAFFFDDSVCRSFPPGQRVPASLLSSMKHQVGDIRAAESGGREDKVSIIDGRGEPPE